MSNVAPSTSELRAMLSKLLNKPVTVRDSYDLVSKGAVATFVNEDGDALAWLAFEIPLAAGAATALAMLPAKMAQTGGRGRSLTGDLHEVFYEVCNILGRIFNIQGRPHVVLKDVTYGPTPDLLQDNNTPTYKVEIKGYGKGNIALATAPEEATSQ